MKEYKWALMIVRTIHDDGKITEQIITKGDKEIGIFEIIFKLEEWLKGVREKLGDSIRKNIQFHTEDKK